MFTRDEYPDVLKSLKLSKKQVKGIGDVLEQMMSIAGRRANRDRGRPMNEMSEQDTAWRDYHNGKLDGLNAAFRFFYGEMDAHDEFDD